MIFGSTKVKYNEHKIKTINIPDSIRFINDCTFRKCIELENIRLSKNLTVLSKYLFESCESLKNVTIYEGIETSIQCNINDKIEEIINKFLLKINTSGKNSNLIDSYRWLIKKSLRNVSVILTLECHFHHNKSLLIHLRTNQHSWELVKLTVSSPIHI